MANPIFLAGVGNAIVLCNPNIWVATPGYRKFWKIAARARPPARAGER